MKTITVNEIFTKLAANGIDQNEIDQVTDLLNNIGFEDVNADTVIDEKNAKKIALYFNVDLLNEEKPKKVKTPKKVVPEKADIIVFSNPNQTLNQDNKKEEVIEETPKLNDDCELLNETNPNFKLTDVYVTRIKAVMILMAYDLTHTNAEQNLFGKLFDEECQAKGLTYQEKYAEQMINGVLENNKKINTIIAFNLKNYTFDRLNSVDRAIIRIAVWEMAFNHTPKSIAIDTALNLTKEYSDIDDKQYKFNNRLLDNIAKFIETTHYGE